MTATVREPHGTNPGYQAHIDYRTPPCGPCRQAHADTERRRRHVCVLLDEVIGVLAEALGLPQGPVCITCRRALRRYRNCPYCGTRDARSAEWPLTRRAA